MAMAMAAGWRVAAEEKGGAPWPCPPCRSGGKEGVASEIFTSSGNAVGALGWLIATWPAIVVPSSSPAEIWCVKLELIAGKTLTLGGMEQIIDNK